MVADGARFTTRFAGLLAILARLESWIKAATVVKEFRGFRKPVLLTTARAAPIQSPHAAVFAHTAAGLHCALPPHISPAAALRRHLAARNQARRLPGHCSQDGQAREALQPTGQCSHLSLPGSSSRQWLSCARSPVSSTGRQWCAATTGSHPSIVFETAVMTRTCSCGHLT
jgi:hypothetical protein